MPDRQASDPLEMLPLIRNVLESVLFSGGNTEASNFVSGQKLKGVQVPTDGSPPVGDPQIESNVLMDIVIEGPRPTTAHSDEIKDLPDFEPWAGAKTFLFIWTADEVRKEPDAYRLACVQQALKESRLLYAAIYGASFALVQDAAPDWGDLTLSQYQMEIFGELDPDHHLDIKTRKANFATFLAQLDDQIAALSSAEASIKGKKQGAYDKALRADERLSAAAFWKTQLERKLSKIFIVPEIFLAVIGDGSALVGVFPYQVSVSDRTFTLRTVVYKTSTTGSHFYAAMVVGSDGSSLARMDMVGAPPGPEDNELVGLYVGGAPASFMSLLTVDRFL
jgi:outer membrane murein-binding lipoprotein Lpp